MEQFYISFLLSSFLLGMLILILLEKRKEWKEEKTKTKKNEEEKKEEKDEVINQEKYIAKKEDMSQEESTPPPPLLPSSSSSSSSCSEEEPSNNRTIKRTKKKHSCKGSALICATKRKITAVSILTHSQDEEVQVSLEELAGEIKRTGVTCSVNPAMPSLLPCLVNEPSHLLLLFGTSSQGCRSLQEELHLALRGGEGTDTPTPPAPAQPFLYSVTCWGGDGGVYESGQELSAALGSCGGAEWLPLTCISEGGAGVSREHHVHTIMEKIAKPGKKCCGTSCGSKTVDIEDLAATLLLPPPAVTS